MERCQTCEPLTAYLNLESSLILLPFMEREEAVTIISVQYSVLCFRLSTNTVLNTPIDLITFRLTLNTQPRNLLAPLPTEWMTSHAHMTNPFNFLSMKILVWNCTGAGNPNFCGNFTDMVCSHRPSIAIILETRISGQRANSVSSSLGFDNVCRSDSDGSRGDITLDILSVNDQTIHVFVQVNASNPSSNWLFTAIYPSLPPILLLIGYPY